MCAIFFPDEDHEESNALVALGVTPPVIYDEGDWQAKEIEAAVNIGGQSHLRVTGLMHTADTYGNH